MMFRVESYYRDAGNTKRTIVLLSMWLVVNLGSRLRIRP
jgi:hypothetical protein